MDQTKDIVFDFDGTLIETRQRHWTVYKRAVEKLGGFPLALPVYWRLKRTQASTDTILRKSKLLSHLRGERAPISEVNIIRRFLNIFVECIEEPDFLPLDTCFPYAKRVLDQLLHSGQNSLARGGLAGNYRMHLVTLRRNEKTLHDELRLLGLTKYFSNILAKPPGQNPAQTKVAMIRSLGVTPFAVIGDTEADIETAQLLGVKSIAVTSGIRSPAILKRYKPNHILRDIRGLRRYLI